MVTFFEVFTTIIWSKILWLELENNDCLVIHAFYNKNGSFEALFGET